MIEDARRVVGAACSVGPVYRCGHEWVATVYLPAVRCLARSRHRADRILASGGYYVVGDIHDFNDAPRAAVRAYKKSLSLWSGQSAALREMGGMLDLMGRRRSALAALERAVALDPTDEHAASDLEIVKRDPCDPPLYLAGDVFWAAAEAIATGRHREALSRLKRSRGMRARRMRARVLGAMGDAGAVLAEWKRMLEGAGTIEIEGPDWYFLPDGVWNSPSFWQMLWGVRTRLQLGPGGFVHESLCAAGARGARLRDLMLRFHRARMGRDSRVASALAAQVPGWTEAQDLAEALAALASIRSQNNRPSSSRTTSARSG